MTKPEFDALIENNPSIKIADNSASSQGKPSGMDWEAIRSTETAAQGTSKRIGKLKKRTRNAKSTKPYVSPHARRLAYLARNPSKIKGNQEHYEQVRLFDDMERHYPDIYEMMAAIPNGGIRDDKTAGVMRAEGQKKGYPDVTLDVSRGAYCSLKIEMKSPTGRASEEQKGYHDKLRRHGNCVVVCYGYEAARKALLEYWSLKDDGEMTAEVYKHAV